MGYYITTPSDKNKAKQLVEMYQAELLFEKPVFTNDKAIIVVIDNGIFEAAGLAYDEAEFLAFTSPTNRRPKQFLYMEKSTAHKLAGYINNE